MGYFGILSDADDNRPDIFRTHLNLWSLPGLFPGRRLFYFDVGVEKCAGEKPVERIQMLLPFRVEEGKWPDGSRVVQDLYEHATHDDTSELIFGGPVAHRTEGGAHYLSVGDYPGEFECYA